MLTQSEWNEKKSEDCGDLVHQINEIKAKLPDADEEEWENLNDQLEELEAEYADRVTQHYDDYRGDAAYDRWKSSRN